MDQATRRAWAENPANPTGKNASHKRASKQDRQTALDELYQSMTELAGAVDQSAKFRQTVDEGDSAKKQELEERFEAFGGGAR